MGMIHDILLTAVRDHLWSRVSIADTRLDVAYADYVTFCEQSGYPLGLPWMGF